MHFAVAEDQVIAGFGLPAGIVIISLVLALLFTVRQLLTSYNKIDAIQEQRIKDAKEVGNNIVTPLERIAEQNKSIYDVLTNSKSRG